MPSSLDENARRAALRRYAVPGTLPEEPFDRITRLAARWFDAPIALIAMANAEGQWIMSCYGLDERETPREVSFCAHTIQGPGMMVVEDATEDERFADDPLVTGAPGIRFYAGVPLVTSDGHRIGALCVIDTEPRHLDDPDARDVLQDLAALAMDEIEMRVAHPHHGDILESITDAFFALDDAWRFTYVNQQAETLLQRTRNELLGKNVWDEFPEAVERDFYEQYHRAMREGESVQFEAYFPPLETWFHVNAYPFEGGLSVYFDDITARKRAEQSLREHEELLASINNHVQEGIYRSTPAEQLIYVNEAFAQLFGYDAPDDLLALDNLSQLYARPEKRDALVRRVHENESFRNKEVEFQRADGSTFWGLISATTTFDEGGAVIHRDGAVLDITDRKRVEDALREREEYLSVTLRSIGDAVLATDADGRVTEMNPLAEELTGWSLADAIDQPLDDIFRIHNAQTGAPMENPVEKVLREGQTVGLANHTVLTARDGTECQIADSAAPIRTADGNLLGVVIVFRDVTEKYAREKALRTERDLLAGIFDTSAAAITVLDAEGQIIRANERAEEVLGLEAAGVEERTYDDPAWKHTTVDGGPFPDEAQPFTRVMETEAPVYDVQHAIEWPDGRRRILSINGAPLRNAAGTVTGGVFIVNDITEQKEREKQLRRRRDLLKQTQRLAGAWEYDIESSTLLWSTEVYRIHEVPPGTDIPLKDGINYYAPEARSTIRSAVQQCIDARTPWDLELPIITAKGNRRRVRTVGAPIVRGDEVVKLAGAFQDVTERKRAERALERSLAEKQRILETTLDGYMLHDMDGIIVDVNPAYCAMVGYDRDTLIGMDIRDLDARFAPEALDRRIANYPDVVEYRFETQHTHREGHRVDLDVSAVMMEDEQGRRLVNAFIRDVTERKAAERALRESEERYRTLVERSHDAIYIYRGTRLLFVNDRVCELTGYAEEELLNMNVFKLVHPDDREQVRQHAIRRVEGKAPSRYEARLVRKDGSVRYGDFSVQAITYQGEYAAIGSIRDVTQRRQVEQALRESEQRFRTLAEETTDVVTRLAPDGTQLYVSPAVQDVLGYAPDELTGTLHQTLIHPDDRAQVEAQVDAARREGKKAQFEYRVQHADGHYVWVETAGQHIPGDGREAALIASTRSVAERKAAEQALVRREQRVESLYEAMQGLTAARTREQVAEHILALIDGTLDYPISAVRYQMGANRLVPVAISAQSQALMPERPDYDRAGNSLAAQAFRRGDTARYRDVRTQHLPYDLGPVRAAAYVPVGSYGIISVGSLQVDAIDDFDLKLIEILARNAEGVLERIDREDALREARDEAEEMSRLKSAFLANMSHEIRTPLTSIIGFAEVLGEQDLGRADQFAALIQRGGQRLLDTLNSVLDLSQLEAGSMRLAPKRMEVRGAVQSAVQFFTPKARDKDITLTLDAPDEPVPAVLDEPALHRILNNLLSNAVKFTPAGGRVDVRLDPHPAHLVLQVEDTGVGIEDDFLPHLFDAFKQESSGDARAFEGSGLGLTITRQLVHLMDGEIAVSTEKGKGTRFVVRLPYRMGRNQGVEA